MIQGVDTKAGAGRIGVLIANGGGNHTAEEWARVVTEGLIDIDPTLPPKRLEAAQRTRQRVQGVFVAAFHEMAPTSSIADVDSAVRTVMGRISEIFAGTPWAENVEFSGVRDQIEAYVRCNLFSAADLALRTE